MFNTLLCLQVLQFGDHGAISLTATCHVEVETKPDIESAYSTQMLIVQTKIQRAWKPSLAIQEIVSLIFFTLLNIKEKCFSLITVCRPFYLGIME